MRVKITPLGGVEVAASRSPDGLYFYTEKGTFLKGEVAVILDPVPVPAQAAPAPAPVPDEVDPVPPGDDGEKEKEKEKAPKASRSKAKK